MSMLLRRMVSSAIKSTPLLNGSLNATRALSSSGITKTPSIARLTESTTLPLKPAMEMQSDFCRNTKGTLHGMLDKRNIRDHTRRLLAAKYELRRKLHKAFCKDPGLPSNIRDKHRYKLSKLPRNSSFARVRNRCIFTGRPRAVYKGFRVSRIVFRGLASRGALMGVKKASW